MNVAVLKRNDLKDIPLNTDNHPTFEYYLINDHITKRWKSPRTFFWDSDLSPFMTEIPVKLEEPDQKHGMSNGQDATVAP